MGDFVQLVAGGLATPQPRLWAPHTPRERTPDGAVGARKPQARSRHMSPVPVGTAGEPRDFGNFALRAQNAPIKMGSWHRLRPGVGFFLGELVAFKSPEGIRSPGTTLFQEEKNQIKLPTEPFLESWVLAGAHTAPVPAPLGPGQGRSARSRCCADSPGVLLQSPFIFPN